MKKAVFLDRDGVIVKQVHFLHTAAETTLENGVAEGIKRLKENGFLVICVSNQSGVARGLFPDTAVAEVNDEIQRKLAEKNTAIDDFFTCFHHPDISGACDCRKPAPGMLLAAAKKWQIDPAASFMCGDKADDVKAGINAGCRKSFLILTGYGSSEKSKIPAGTPVCRDFTEFVNSLTDDATNE